MSQQSKWDYFKAIYERYHKASQEMRTRILDEFCRVCGYHRKYAIRKLRGPCPPSAGRKRKRKRDSTYSLALLQVLTAVWEAAGYPCSVRLKALLPCWMPWIRKQFHLTPEIEQHLLCISPRTIDYRLKSKKRQMKKRLYGRTKPGTLLKHHIPIKTDHWDVKTPGFTEVDLVSHSGNCAEGHFAYSVNQTDILTTWTETRAVLGKGERGVLQAMDEMEKSFPFPLRGIDSDNGSEFINHHLYKRCAQRSIQFTRGRPYKKDDNAHIEQKNWTHVRKLMGWDRYDSQDAVDAMNDLYQNELRLFQNLFLPSMKLVEKKRIGSRLKRVYDTPQTPLERVLASPDGDRDKITRLKGLSETVNPFELSKTIEKKLEHIWNLAHVRFSPSKSVPVPSQPRRTQTPKRVEEDTLKELARIFPGLRIVTSKPHPPTKEAKP